MMQHRMTYLQNIYIAFSGKMFTLFFLQPTRELDAYLGRLGMSQHRDTLVDNGFRYVILVLDIIHRAPVFYTVADCLSTAQNLLYIYGLLSALFSYFVLRMFVVNCSDTDIIHQETTAAAVGA